jgi:signal transduction histidine kinase
MRILKERDRLLGITARGVGLAATVTVFLCLSIPGALPWPLYVAAIPLLMALGFAQYRLGLPDPMRWIVVIVVIGVIVMALNVLPGVPLNPASLSALGTLTGASIASCAMIFVTRRGALAYLVATFAITLGALASVLIGTGSALAMPICFTVAGWIALSVTGYWLAATIPRLLHRITNMSRAYQAERQASETEARRRQSARLLHDTVLATLTLLAHSGVGVSADALREQAGEDAALLRQLRLGYTPNPVASGDYKLKPVEQSTLGNTLESVKQRFRRMGLEVNWHGTGQVLLPSDILDAFLLALAECLENVRRHSGVSEAHVTITDDEVTVRAMVTDSGRGFDIASIGEGRLGFSESIVARLRDVGGNARLFSSPGSGTTVVLEVPK